MLCRLIRLNLTGIMALTGHYNTVPASPEANDDGSAVGTLLEAARCILSGQFRYGTTYLVSNYEYTRDIELPAGSAGMFFCEDRCYCCASPSLI